MSKNMNNGTNEEQKEKGIILNQANMKRNILVTLLNYPGLTLNEIVTRNSGEDKEELEFYGAILSVLENEGFIRHDVKKDSKPMCFIYSLTERSLDLAKHWTCQKRWEQTIKICNQLEDISEVTVSHVYDKILEKDITEQVGNPINNLIGAIENLSTAIDNMRYSRRF